MDKAEAECVFAARGVLGYEEFYEEELFEYKNFFRSKPPVAKVFKGKIQKLQRLQEAYDLLVGEEGDVSSRRNNSDFNDNVLDAFNEYFRQRNLIMHRINISQSGSSLIEAVAEYLQLFNEYSKKWGVL